MPTNWSIRAQLAALMLAIILPLAGLGVYSIFVEYRVSTTRAEENTLSIAEVTAANFRQFLADAEGTLSDLAQSEDIRATSPASCNPVLEPLRPFLPQYTNVFVIAPDLTLVCSAIPLPESVIGRTLNAERMENMFGSRRFALGRPHISAVSGDWVSSLFHPIEDDAGNNLGYVGLSLDLLRFQTLLLIPNLPSGAVITIDDRDGMVVARSLAPEEWVGRQLPQSDVSLETLEGTSGLTRTRGAEGIERLWAFSEIPETEWRVWVGLPTAGVYAPVRNAAIRTALFSLLIFLGVGLLAFLVHARIVRSLTALIEGARRGAEGEIDSMPLNGPAEVAEVAAQFNRTLDARSRAEERYRSIMENAAFGIYVSTPEGRFLEVNPALIEMLGYESREELLSVPVPALYRFPHRRDELIAQHEGRSRIEVVEVEWLRRDGTPVTVLLNGNVIRDPSGKVAYEAIVEDMTERRHLEEQLRHSQKMEAVGRIAGGVAHDFNNLLTVITAEADLILEELDAADVHRPGVEEMRRAADRATALTRQLLAFSRKSVLQPTVLDPNRIVHEMDGMLARVVGRQMHIRTALAHDLHSVRVDPGQLHQVLMNLVLNARDAMGGEGSVEIRTENIILDDHQALAGVELEAGAYVRISVRDEGPGIPWEIQNRVFEPFFTTKPEGAGTGLGLATVYGIAVQSGGHVELQSEPGRGALFAVYLPVALEHGEAAVSNPPVPGPPDRAGSATVLVAEDEEAIRRIVARILRAKGYAVLEAESGDRALEIARAHEAPIHLLLSDVVMPGMRGPALVDGILSLRPGIRIVLMSGHSEDPDVHRVGPHGQVPFLPKPFSAEQLLRAVQDALDDPVSDPVPV